MAVRCDLVVCGQLGPREETERPEWRLKKYYSPRCVWVGGGKLPLQWFEQTRQERGRFELTGMGFALFVHNGGRGGWDGKKLGKPNLSRKEESVREKRQVEVVQLWDRPDTLSAHRQHGSSLQFLRPERGPTMGDKGSPRLLFLEAVVQRSRRHAAQAA